MKLLELAIIELEDPEAMNPVIFDLFDFSGAYPLYEEFKRDAMSPPTQAGSSIVLKSGARITVKQTTRQVYNIIEKAATAIREASLASNSSPDTASAQSAVGSGRMATQQAANAQEEESRRVTQTDETNSSESGSGSKTTDMP